MVDTFSSGRGKMGRKGISRRDFLRLAGSAAVVGGVTTLPGRRSFGASEPLKIGIFGPYSGPLKSTQDEYMMGFMLRIEANKGMVAGRKITLLEEDTRFNPSIGLDKVRKFLSRDRVDVLLGPVSSAVAGAVRDTVAKSDKIWIVGVAGNNDLTGKLCAPNIFRVAISNWAQAAPFGPWAKAHVADRFAVFYANFAYGQQASSDFIEAFTKAGGTVLESIAAPVNTTDFSPFLTKIKTLKPQAIYVVFPGAAAVNLVKQFDRFGLRDSIRLTGAGSLTEPAAVLRAQGESARGIITCHLWSPTIPNKANVDFMRAYQERYNTGAGLFAVIGYDNADFLLQGLERTGGDPSPDKLIPVLRSVKLNSPRGTITIDPETHNGIMDIYVREVKEHNGQLTNVMIDRLQGMRLPNFGCTMKGA